VRRTGRLTRRTPLNPVSRRRKPAHDEPAVRVTVWCRAGGRCERCGTTVTLLDYNCHHRKLRRCRIHTPDNRACLCRSCHRHVHDVDRAGAEADGFIVRQSADHTSTPVRLWSGGSWLLSPTGGYLRPAATAGEDSTSVHHPSGRAP
jgi:hypothetical protein